MQRILDNRQLVHVIVSFPIGSELFSHRRVPDGNSNDAYQIIGTLLHDTHSAHRQILQSGSQDLSGVCEGALVLAFRRYIGRSVQKIITGYSEVLEHYKSTRGDN